MKRTPIALIICLFINFTAIAQDTYHTSLQNYLQSNFDLPAGTWVFNNSENGNFNIDYHYGNMTVATQSATMQTFEQKLSFQVLADGANPWDAGYGLPNLGVIDGGDACLLVLWLRAPGGGKVNIFVENASTYEKEVILTVDLSDNWVQYLIPFESGDNYAPGALTTGLHLGWQAQTVELGGLTMLNYDQYDVDALPSALNNEQYGGWEADAPWRADASSRIEAFRKADLTVRVLDGEGNPIPDAQVDVEMLQHDYAFGTAVVSRFFAGNNSQNETYESKLLDLDGEGHGFNWVVFENAMKWPGWENNWIASKPETANATQWLRDHDIKVRGHCLVWPGWSNLPDDIEENQDNLQYIRNRFNEHIEALLTYPGIEGNVAEWDVLNEITTNRDLEYAFQGEPGYPTGREVYREIFEKLEEVDPDTETYVNDYVTIGQGNTGGGLYDLKKQFIQELIDAGVQLDGIGFQGHIGGFPTSIYNVYDILQDFYATFGLKAKITEYDTNEAMDDELAANYMRDFLTMVFSHPSTNGFMMWGFWDGAHWHDNAPLFYYDWTLKPAGETFIDLVYNEWWTEDSGNTDAAGEFNLRGFKGKYQITVDTDAGLMTDTIELLSNTIVIKTGDQLEVVGNHQLFENLDIRVYPNPAKDYLRIEKPNSESLNIRIFDMSGKLVFESIMNSPEVSLPLHFGTGVFDILLEQNGQTISKKIVIVD
jgi:endo-1,4-beta-xylanase